jgi:tetratricopeptide (TPR) repeat protein
LNAIIVFKVLPGVRALEATSLRLESIMRHREANERAASHRSRLAFVWGAILLTPGLGLDLGFRAGPMAGQVDASASIRVNELGLEGRKLTDEQARALEDAVQKKPDDVDSRIKLMAFYMMGQYRRPELRKARQAHVLWLIENQPAHAALASAEAVLMEGPGQDGDTFYEARILWKKQVDAHPKDPAVLGNAAAYLLLSRSDEAEALLKRCIELEPDNRVWHEKLAQLLMLRVNHNRGDDHKRDAAQATRELERALELSRNDARSTSLLINLAKSSFEATEYEKARRAATELLDRVEKDQKTYDKGAALHHANLILGRLALVAGDVAAAKRYLLAAGATPGSPSLGSFGPNMMLAKELLERGETQAVLDYFALCAKFWRSDRGRLKAWTDAVKAGIAPEFGANLVY